MIDNQSTNVLKFQSHDVRVAMIDGEPWWVLRDVCNVLGVGNSGMVASRLDEDQKGVISTDTLGGQQDVLAVSESGLYEVIFSSRKPQARAFKRWAAQKVQDLRRHGVALAGGDSELAARVSNSPIHAMLVEQERQAMEQERLAIEQDRVSGLVDEIEDGYVTIVGWSNRRGVAVDRNQAQVLGKLVSDYCRGEGTRIGKVKNNAWGEVNTYPESCIDVVAEDSGLLD